ncbi:MAG: TlpA family protein disulfide reductase [Bacteroidetes bacterium]|nr:TlpA family protein disulfide reductase [Bacteroidota bacterium]
MEKRIFIFSLFFTFCSFLSFSQNLILSPEFPSPGDEITFKYNPTGTQMEKAESFDAIAYLFEGDLPVAKEVQLKAINGIYKGSIETNTETKAVFFTFMNEEEDISDNNDDKGYSSLLYTPSSKTPVPGASFNMARVYASYGRIVNVKRNQALALKHIKKEFESYPDSKTDGETANFYSFVASQNNDEEALADVKTIAEGYLKKRKKTEDDWMNAYRLYNSLKETEKVEEIEKKLRKKYPKGQLVKNDVIRSFRSEKELDKKGAIYEKVKKNYGNDENIESTLNSFASQLANAYAKKKDWANFDKYMGLNSNNGSKAGVLNNLAWEMAGAGLDKEGEDLEIARKLSKQSLDFVKGAMEKLEGKPSYVTDKQWKENQKASFGMYADTYALTLYKTGAYEKALKYQKKACQQDDFKSGEMNERYCIFYEKVKGQGETEALLEDFIRKGAATTKMKEQYKKAFMTNNSMEDAYEKYLAVLEEKANEHFKEEIKKEMFDKAPVDFQLLDFEGKEVSLQALKGKVVVLDFWAIWCGPCKASFPGMQRAVNKYAEDSEVEFLFIDTWEKGKDKKKAAKDFIDGKGYNFHVLMDEENEVVGKYGVEGIPTKFVLDKNGHIRFKSVGYSGNDDKLVKEMSIMIELAKEASSGKMVRT